MEVLQHYYDHYLSFYNYHLNHSDPRTKNWLLMRSYSPTLLLTLGYLFLVYIGPKLMKNRLAFELKMHLFVYNFAMVLLNFHIFKELVVYSIKRGYSYTCQPIIYDYNEDEMHIARALWWYYFSKLIEFMDTFFFILRKKNSQITFLHVYHHATMFPIWWIGIRWVAGGQSFFGATLNSFVHVIMYTYYGLAGFGPQMRPYLWWKKYMTKIQLLQFFIGTIHTVNSIRIDCNFPKWMHWALLVYALSMIFLFMNFYVMTYHSKATSHRNLKKETTGEILCNGSSSRATMNGDVVCNGTNKSVVCNGSSDFNSNYEKKATRNGSVRSKKD